MAQPGRIDIWRLARERARIAGDIATGALPRLADRLAAPSSVHYELSGEADPRCRPAAQLRLAGELILACDRCGEPVSWQLEQEAHYFFVADEAALEAVPIDDPDPAEALVGSTAFDLGALIEDDVLLALPISPRHADCAPERPQAAREAPVPGNGASPAQPTQQPFHDLAALLGRRRGGPQN